MSTALFFNQKATQRTPSNAAEALQDRIYKLKVVLYFDTSFERCATPEITSFCDILFRKLIPVFKDVDVGRIAGGRAVQ
jgi:hypothetical protein